jgi:hypothetical protein
MHLDLHIYVRACFAICTVAAPHYYYTTVGNGFLWYGFIGMRVSREYGYRAYGKNLLIQVSELVRIDNLLKFGHDVKPNIIEGLR